MKINQRICCKKLSSMVVVDLYGSVTLVVPMEQPNGLYTKDGIGQKESLLFYFRLISRFVMVFLVGKSLTCICRLSLCRQPC